MRPRLNQVTRVAMLRNNNVIPFVPREERTQGRLIKYNKPAKVEVPSALKSFDEALRNKIAQFRMEKLNVVTFKQ